MIAERLVRALAAMLPAGVRERYREEWLADIDGADDVGITRGQVVWGALSVAASIDRDDPVVSGLAPTALALRRVRVALASLVTAMLLVLAGFWWEASNTLGVIALPGVGWWISAATGLAVVVSLVFFLGAGRAVTRAVRRPVTSGVVVLLSFAALVVLAIAAALIWIGAIWLVAVAVVLPTVLIFVILLLIQDPRSPQQPVSRLRAVGLALLSGVLILGALAAWLLHIYLWNPLARMPGMGLDEIYAGLRDSGELPSPVLPVLWAGFWGGVVLALLVLAVLPQPRIRRWFTARRLVLAGLGGVALVGAGAWFVGFGMGMGMADAFATSGADAAASGLVLTFIGIASAIAGVILGLAPAPLRIVENAGELPQS